MRKPAVVAALIIAVACTDRTPVTPDLGAPNASISDAVHEAGNAHFYFLPPLVGDPATTGVFDGSLLPYLSVAVCPWSGNACIEPPVAEFTAEDGTGSEIIRLVPEDEHYIVNWHTEGLASSVTYRIRILVAGTELGHADVDVVDNGAGLRNVDTDEYIGLVDGRTLPIKFRIEEGAVFVVGTAGGTIVAAAGQVILRIPENALASPVGITVKPGATALPEEGTIPGTLWEFGPDGTEFGVPAKLAIGYAPDALPPDIADPATSLVLATQEDGEWVESPTTVDVAGYFVTGPVFGFSVKAVAEKTLELDVQPSSLILAPSASAELASSARSRERKILKKRALRKIALDERVATVDQSGFVRAIGVGSTVLRVTPRLPRLFPPGLDPCALPYVLCTFPRRDIPVVVRRPVASVTVSPATAMVAVGASVQLVAELRDAEGNLLTDREVTWTSTAPDIASVDGAGLVTGASAGNATIHATSEEVIGSAEIEVVPGGLPSVPAGFTIELVADLEQRPVGLAFAPEGSEFGPDLYVAGRGGDAGTPDNIYRVASGGVTVFAPLLPEADPVDLEFAPAGSAFGAHLYVSANNRDGGLSGDHGGTIQRIDASGAVTDFTLVGEASGLTEPRGMAFANGGGFGFDLYVANHVNAPMDVARIASGGGIAGAFFEGGLALSDLEFGRGGDFGTDLYVADWEGCSCVRRVTSGATVSGSFAVLPGFPGALHFGPGGGFGTDLYLVVGGTIHRVSPSGTVTVFASGFGSLGLDALAFTGDGSALYVADAGTQTVYRITTASGGARREYSWTQLPSGTTRSLREVWGASGSDVFATADVFEVFHFDGLTWSLGFRTPDTLSFAGLSGRADNDVFAVGSKRDDAPSCGGRTNLAFVLRFDGTAWRTAGFPIICNSAHRGAWAGPQTVLAVGNSPHLAIGDQLGRIWRLRDGSWTLEFTLFGDTLSAFLHAWGSGETDVYAVGGGNLFGSAKTPFGVIVHYDGVNWSVVSDEIEKPLNAVWGTSSSDVFAVGQEGLILHFDGTRWTRQESGVTVNLGGVWGSAPDNVFAVGGAGTILHYDGRTWMPLESNTTTGLTAVWTTPSGDSVFAVGQGGLILLGTAQR